MMRAFVRGMQAFKAERAGFVSFAQKKFGLTRDVTEEAYEYLIDSLSQDGFAQPVVVERAIESAKKLVRSDKPVSQADIVDYTFLRAALKK
jgi:hypothetical protein